MTKLWNYEDYVNYLSHDNKMVRRWAFDKIENHYPNRYTDEVSKLIGDENDHLACAAPRYIAEHEAVQHAPAIMYSFKNDQGNAPGHCATALGKMKYEPAMDSMFEYCSDKTNMETLYGVFDYFGSMDNDTCREMLISAAMQINDMFLRTSIIHNLFKHNNIEDIYFILDNYFDPNISKWELNVFQSQGIAQALGGGDYFRNIYEYPGKSNILENPEKVLDDFLENNSHLNFSSSILEKIIYALKKNQYQDFITIIMFDGQSIVNSRYSKEVPEWLKESQAQDKMCIALLEYVSKRPALIKDLTSEKKEESLIPLIISVYCVIKDREAYLKAFSPDAKAEDLLYVLKNAGSSLPVKIRKKIKELSPVSELNKALSDDLITWGDVWIVRMMGQIGSPDFIPALIRVLNDSGSMDYIFSDALFAINALDESADEMLLSAIENRQLDEANTFSVLEHLPYSKSYDLALRTLADEDNDIDCHEMFAYCLKGIGDKRGIKKLQEIYANENDAGYIGKVLECLALIHNVNIPELPDIYNKRKSRDLSHKNMLRDIRAGLDNFTNKNRETSNQTPNVIPFEKTTPKIGKNAKCPCGSGKKYKKCCLNK
ncbi:SEC-C metal-binding domain-containing protein [Desulfobacterales bacterium HSG17]|nr:SEC-C metal-binding domain-containing protein [Desulfobacterales bacterium HSG17]